MTSEQPERFAIVALMGHRQVAGRVSEEVVAGVPTLRVDIPQPDGGWSTRNFGGAAIYEIAWVTEEVARAVAGRDPAHPVSVWSARSLGLLPELPAQRDPDDVLDEGVDGEDDELDEADKAWPF